MPSETDKHRHLFHANLAGVGQHTTMAEDDHNHGQASESDVAGIRTFLDRHNGRNKEFGYIYEAGGGSVAGYQPFATSSPSERSNQTKKIYDYGIKAHSLQEHSADSTSLELTAMADNEYPAPAQPEGAHPEEVEDTDLTSDEKDQSIYDLIYEAALPSKSGQNRDWLPVNRLRDIFQPHRVRQELTRHFHDANLVEAYVRYVCGNPNDPEERGEDNLARRLLAILILHRGDAVEEYLPRLVEQNIKDRQLPFLRANSQGLPRHQLLDCQGKPLTCLGVQPGFTKPFYSIQWQVLAPFITREADGSVHEYRMHKDAMFPWTDVKPVKRPSTFSHVDRVDIHPAHHTFPEKHFALKTLIETETDKGDQEFQAELRVFIKMKPEPNLLTELYATFVVEGNESDGRTRYSFLFPWADGGSMDQLFEKPPMKLIDDTTTTPRLLLQWLAEQCHGLADGLRSLHDTRAQALKRAKEPSPALSPELSRGLTQLSREVSGDQDDPGREDRDSFGIHGDLKPGNILHFTQSPGSTGLGTLKIADFGLTQFFTRSRRSPVVSAPGVHTPARLTYSAPELMLKRDHYSRKADIWALGCIFSELITWVMLGREGVEEYKWDRFAETNVDTSGGHFKAQCSRIATFFRVEFGPDRDSERRTMLKDAVRKHHAKLKSQLRRPGQPNSDILTDLLDFIEVRMLDPRRTQRIDCDTLVTELERFQKLQQASPPGDPYWDPPLPSFAGSSRRGNHPETAALVPPKILVNALE